MNNRCIWQHLTQLKEDIERAPMTNTEATNVLSELVTLASILSCRMTVEHVVNDKDGLSYRINVK